jgi:hypothetical protein
VTDVNAKSQLGAWLGKKHRRLTYAAWLAEQTTTSLRSFTPSPLSRAVLAGFRACHGRFDLPTRLRVPAPPSTKVRAIRWHARHYGCRLFVETGTCWGDTTAAVADLFDICWTIELSDDLYTRACNRFRGTRIECLHGDSGALIQSIVTRLTAPTLFWLDAHATGGDITADAGYDPIFAELDAIFSSDLAHVVLIDDARGHDVDAIKRRAGPNRCSVVRNDIIRITP